MIQVRKNKFFINFKKEFYILQFLNLDEFFKAYIILFNPKRTENIKENVENKLRSYLKFTLLNQDENLVHKILNHNKNKSLIFKENFFLPIFIIYSNSGKFDNPEIKDKNIDLNINNIFFINDSVPLFDKMRTIYSIDILAGIYFKIDCKEFSNLRKSFICDKSTIETFDKNNKILFQELQTNNIDLKLDNLTVALHKNDRDYFKINYKLDFINKFKSLEFKPFCDLNYCGPNSLINPFLVNESISNNVYFMIRNIKLLTCNKNVRFIIYVTESDKFIQENCENYSEEIKKLKMKYLNKETIHDTYIPSQNESDDIINLILSEDNLKNKNFIISQKNDEFVNIYELNLNHFKKEILKPFIIVEIKKYHLFQDIYPIQNFISKFVFIKQVRGEGVIKVETYSGLKKILQDKNKLKYSEHDLYKKNISVFHLMNINGNLSKVYLYGSMFNSE